jgi:AcrR family transcriptional regulator
MLRRKRPDEAELLRRCLLAFVGAGTMDLSLDQLASKVGISKRMLIHYFGGRENIEERTMALLEERLRAQFAPESFPLGVTPETVVTALWERTTAPESKGVLLLIMDLSRRAWNGSTRAKAFYLEQQRLWVQLLAKFLPDLPTVERVLQLFQGAVLAYLVTGDPEPGRRTLTNLISNERMPKRDSAGPRRVRRRR